MIELIKTSCRDQFGAALMMLRNSIEQCEAANWAKTVGRFPFWQVAYHTLYCTDMYLSPGMHAFRPQPFHREGYESFAKDEDTRKQLAATEPYSQVTLLGYVDTCMKIINQTIMTESESVLRGASGFSWLAFPRLQVHLYNIRHLQHHAGQLSAFLNREQNAATKWVRAYDPT